MTSSQQRLALTALALSCLEIPEHSYSFTETRQVDGVTVGRLTYHNPWLRIECAVRIAADWYLSLEHSGLGTWTFGGFHDLHHYQFRALQETELERRSSLFLDWALALKARYFDPGSGVI